MIPSLCKFFGNPSTNVVKLVIRVDIFRTLNQIMNTANSYHAKTY
jgi:hypothetical protein